MAGLSDDAGFELNEIGWWSQWADIEWLDEDTYVFFSSEFDEYFFNRAGFVRVTKNAAQSIASIEKEFRKRERVAHVLVQRGYPRLSGLLSDKGYRITDKMIVMEMSSPSFNVNSEIELDVGSTVNLKDWAEIYLTSFYGEMELERPVLRILERISGTKETSLVLARIGRDPVGCLVLFRSEKLCGVYCVGTRPEFRRRNVASTMLEGAYRLSAREGRRPILQTMSSDSLESFYTKLGFKTAYLKDLFVEGQGSAAN